MQRSSCILTTPGVLSLLTAMSGLRALDVVRMVLHVKWIQVYRAFVSSREREKGCIYVGPLIVVIHLPWYLIIPDSSSLKFMQIDRTKLPKPYFCNWTRFWRLALIVHYNIVLCRPGDPRLSARASSDHSGLVFNPA